MQGFIFNIEIINLGTYGLHMLKRLTDEVMHLRTRKIPPFKEIAAGFIAEGSAHISIIVWLSRYPVGEGEVLTRGKHPGVINSETSEPDIIKTALVCIMFY